MKKRLIGSLVSAVAFVGCNNTPSMDSQARATANTQNVGGVNVLALSGAPSNSSAKVVVGPAAGRVEVYGMPGIADGAVFTGIQKLTWFTGPGFPNLQVEVTQSSDFDVDIETGAGDATVQTKWIIPAGASSVLTPSLNIKTGPGSKKVEVQVESFAQNVDFSYVGLMGAGLTESKNQLQFKQGSQNVNALVDIRFGAATGNKGEIIVDNEARNFNLNLDAHLMSELNTIIVGDDPADSANVNFNSSLPAAGGKIGFEMLSAAPKVAVNHNIKGGASLNEINLGLTTLSRAQISSKVNATTFSAADKIGLKYDGLETSTLNLSGAINSGAGDDEVALLTKGILNSTLALDCSGGLFDKAIDFPSTPAPVGCELN
jgi:hypothetical protein